jgi:AcrR family transcriptional regulator
MPPERDGGHRERLLEGAIACLQEKGYARTSARDIVAASGSNLASIGYHFGSKERLLNAALIEAFQRWLKPLIALAAADPGPATPLERLARTLQGILGTLEEKRPLLAACLEAWAQIPRSADVRADLRRNYEDFRSVIAQMTRDAFAEVGAPDVDADTLAMVLIALFDGLIVHWQLDAEGTPSPERLLAAAEGAINALGAGARTPPPPGVR